MPKSVIDDLKFPLVCENCRHEFSKTIGWLDRHRSITCPSCSHSVRLDNEKLRRIRAQALKLSKNLNRTIKINIKL